MIFQDYHVVVTAVTSEGNISVSSNNITILPENIQTNGVVVKDGLPCDKQGNLFSWRHLNCLKHDIQIHQFLLEFSSAKTVYTFLTLQTVRCGQITFLQNAKIQTLQHADQFGMLHSNEECQFDL